jgi:NTE family protein
MVKNITNIVFEGGGIHGIAYLGALEYLYQIDLLRNLRRAAGTSSGAIAACITSFHHPFDVTKSITNSLDYRKVPYQEDFNELAFIPEDIKNGMEPLFGDIGCLYRLISQYGWYSTDYFYQWLKQVIANQFNHKKKPPYTFQDFKDSSLHKDNHPFLDLFITGTNLTTGTSQVFSYETTPLMEVAYAVRISVSIPLFFEAITVNQPEITGNSLTNVFCDGGILRNYPIKLFDQLKYSPNLLRGANMGTLGLCFQSRMQNHSIHNLFDFIWSLASTFSQVQEESFYNDPMDRIRSIVIDPLDISPIDFNVTTGDQTYHQLYLQGYSAAKAYFAQS